MSTRAELLAGADYEGWEGFCDTLVNMLKNHWRQSDPKSALTQAQPGEIASDEDDDKLWLRVGDSLVWDEILQENESFDAEPVFAALKLDVIESDVSDPPTDAELDALFGTPGSVGRGWHKFIKDTSSGGKLYLIVSDLSNWWTFTGTLAV